MESFFKKNINTIIAIFLLIGPFLDLATGVCIHYFHIQFTAGVLIRVLFFISICLITLFVFKKKQLIVPYLIIGLFFIFHMIGVFLYKDGLGVFTELQNLIKVFYFPTLLISFYAIREEIHTSKLTLFTVLFFYLILIFIPFLFNMGYKTYEVTKVGTLGFFNSANEISGIISLLTPILFYILVSSRRWLPRIIFMIMYLVVILMVGTKTPLLTFCITSGLSLGYLWFYYWKKKQYKKVGISLGLVALGIVGLLMVLPRTNFYKNIQLHLEYLQLESIHEVFEKKETIDHFIFSQRLTFLNDKALIYKESPLYLKLFGIGYLKNGEEIKQIEMDYFDIYYNYGVIGFLIFFLSTLHILYKLLENKVKKDYERYITEISVIFIFFLAFFTGHILTTPSVGLICILIILSLQKHHVKQVLVVSPQSESNRFLEDLESSHCNVFYQEGKKSKIHQLWFKILHYKTCDLSICREEVIEYGIIASKKQLILVDRKKKEQTDKKYVTKKDLQKNIDYYLRK